MQYATMISFPEDIPRGGQGLALNWTWIEFTGFWWLISHIYWRK